MPITKIQKKRDGLQGYRVRVNYTDPDTGAYRRIERIVYGKAEAADMERQLNAEIKAPAPTADDRLTVAEFIPQFLSYKANEVRPNTLALMERHLRNHVLDFFGPLRLRDVSPRHVADWVASLHDSGCAPSSVSSYYVAAKSMFARAVELRILRESPFGRLRLPRDTSSAAPRQDFQFYTPEQFRRFYAAAEASASSLQDWHYVMFFVVAFFTGMRRGEILALRWTDIDFPARLIRVRRSYSAAGRAEQRVETAPKTPSSVRDLGIPAPLVDALQAHLSRQSSMPGFSPGLLVCGGPSHLIAATLRAHCIAYADSAGLPHIRVHDFRHSHATLLANNGINIQEIARRLGHSNTQVTWATYAHLYPREIERAITILDAVALPPQGKP